MAGITATGKIKGAYMSVATPRRYLYAAVLGSAGLVATATAVADTVFVDQYMPLRSELMIADADGSNPRKLLPGIEIDYNASFSFDDEWVVFTSDRAGSADIFRVRTDGTRLERLTDSPAFDDQAELSPDGRLLAFVSTRGDGSTDIYIKDLQSGKVSNITNAPGGDFRPSWAPDGQTIAFSSDRGTGFPHQGYPGPAGKWEHVHATSIYLVRPDGSGLRRLTEDQEMASGSPKWSADGRKVIFYEAPIRQTAQSGRGTVSNIVSIDLATGTRTVHVAGPGLNITPQFLAADRIGYLTKRQRSSNLAFTDMKAKPSPDQDIMTPAWSHDGRRLVYHAGQFETMHHYSNPPGTKLLAVVKDPELELVHASGFPAVSPDGRLLALTERGPTRGDDRMAVVVWDVDGTNPRRLYVDDVTVMGLEFSRDGQWLAFGAGYFLGSRVDGPARIMIMRPDGSDVRALTRGPGNAGFPSWSPDGRSIVYRYWTDKAGGLRIVDVASGESRVLSTGWDTLPVWSPDGEVIMFTRSARDDRFDYDEFDIYTMRPDGTDIKRLTDSEGNDAHSHWSPDGERILWSSSRLGFKEEGLLSIDQSQAYAELFIMNADGSNQRPLTDNQYEEGTPAWVPAD